MNTAAAQNFGFNVNGVEAFWIFTTGACLLLMISFFLETRSDKLYNELYGVNGAAKIVAESGIRRQALKVIVTLMLFIPSILTGLYTSPLPEGISAITLLCLSSVPVLLLLINVIDRLERHALFDYFETLTPAERRQETEDAIQKQETDAQDVRDSSTEADR